MKGKWDRLKEFLQTSTKDEKKKNILEESLVEGKILNFRSFHLGYSFRLLPVLDGLW
jgi:hypothetical protein